MNDRVKGGCFIGLGLHLCVCVCVLVLQALLFPPHIISEVKVIYGCQEVPRSTLMPKKTLTWVGWGWRGLSECHTHEMLSCISCVKGPRGGPILNPVAWEMKEFQRLPGPLSSRPDPRTNLFHLLFLLAEGGMLFLLLLLLVLWELCSCRADRLRDMWLCPPSLSPFSLCCITPLIPPHSFPTSLPPLSLRPRSLPPSLPFLSSPSMGLWAGQPSLWLSPLPSFLSSSTNSSLVPD